MICELCFHRCDLSEGRTGLCRARVCREGAIVPLNYGRVTSLALGPRGNIGAAYTYNEPLVGYEYVRDCAAAVRARGMVNVLVINGTVEEAPWRALLPLIDAANIDLKDFTPEWYRRLGGDLETVKRSIALAAALSAQSLAAGTAEIVRAFAAALAQGAGERTRFILATFGDAFALAEEDVPGEDLAERVGDLPFDEGVTRLHTAIGQTPDYFEDLPRQGSELRCLVLLTDAVQYDPQGGVPYDELMERVRQSDVMLHSVGLGTDRASLESLGKLAAAPGGGQTAASQGRGLPGWAIPAAPQRRRGHHRGHGSPAEILRL